MDSLHGLGVRELRHSGVKLLHLGYLPGEVGRKEKYLRNLRLLDLQFKSEPNDLYNGHKYATTLLDAGQIPESLIIFKSVHEKVRLHRRHSDLPFLEDFYVGFAMAFRQQGALEAACQLLGVAAEKLNGPPSILLARAEVALSAGHYETAAKLYKFCSEVSGTTLEYLKKSRLGLAKIAIQQRDIASAVGELATFIDERDLSSEVLVLNTQVSILKNDFAETAKILEQMLKHFYSEPKVQHAAGLVAWSMGDDIGATELFQIAAELGGPQNAPSSFAWLTLIALSKGQFEQASEKVKSVVAVNLESASAVALMSVLRDEQLKLDLGINRASLLESLREFLTVLKRYEQKAILKQFANQAPSYELLLPGITSVSDSL